MGHHYIPEAVPKTGSLENAPRPGRPSEGVTLELMDIINKQMERNDELTSPGLTKLMYEEFSIQKVKRLRQKLAWVQTGTKYCQLIHEPNRIKGLEFSESVFERMSSSMM